MTFFRRAVWRGIRRALKIQPKVFLPARVLQGLSMRARERKALEKWRGALVVGRARSSVISLFCHVPKTGGTSIRKNLEEVGFIDLDADFLSRNTVPGEPVRLMNIHLSMDWLFSKKLLDSNEVSQAFTFCFSRNPYTRAVSLFNYLLGRGFVPPTWSFSQFLRYLGRARPRAGGAKIAQLNLAATQKSFVASDYWRGPTRVFKMERFNDAVSELSEIFATPFPVLHLNPSPALGAGRPLNDLEVRLIYELFKDDFEFFEYSSDVPTSLRLSLNAHAQ